MGFRLDTVYRRLNPRAATRGQNIAVRSANVAARLLRIAPSAELDYGRLDALASRLEESCSCAEHALNDLETFAEEHGQ